MLKNTQVIYHIKLHNGREVRFSLAEYNDLNENLTQPEKKLYEILKNAWELNVPPEYFKTQNLAKLMHINAKTCTVVKSRLKTKGYAQIRFFKDENNKQMVRVVVGKEQMVLYQLGVLRQIMDSAQYDALLEEYPITDPDLSTEEREDLIQQFNSNYEGMTYDQY